MGNLDNISGHHVPHGFNEGKVGNLFFFGNFVPLVSTECHDAKEKKSMHFGLPYILCGPSSC